MIKDLSHDDAIADHRDQLASFSAVRTLEHVEGKNCRESRDAYAESGSFGLTNDMLRLAEDVIDCRLQAVALFMLLVTLCVLPAAFCMWRISSRYRSR